MIDWLFADTDGLSRFTVGMLTLCTLVLLVHAFRLTSPWFMHLHHWLILRQR
jgi:hypothetical protein